MNVVVVCVGGDRVNVNYICTTGHVCNSAVYCTFDYCICKHVKCELKYLQFNGWCALFECACGLVEPCAFTGDIVIGIINENFRLNTYIISARVDGP